MIRLVSVVSSIIWGTYCIREYGYAVGIPLSLVGALILCGIGAFIEVKLVEERRRK